MLCFCSSFFLCVCVCLCECVCVSECVCVCVLEIKTYVRWINAQIVWLSYVTTVSSSPTFMLFFVRQFEHMGLTLLKKKKKLLILNIWRKREEVWSTKMHLVSLPACDMAFVLLCSSWWQHLELCLGSQWQRPTRGRGHRHRISGWHCQSVEMVSALVCLQVLLCTSAVL